MTHSKRAEKKGSTEGRDVFEGLFLSKDEENIYRLKRLENRFILSTEDMLEMLRKKVVDTKVMADRAIDSYFDYKSRLNSEPTTINPTIKTDEPQ